MSTLALAGRALMLVLSWGIGQSALSQPSSPRQVALEFARAGVPAVVVMSRERMGAPATVHDVSRDVPLSTRLQELVASTPGVLAMQEAGVVQITERQLPRAVETALLDGVYIQSTVEVPAAYAVFRLMSAALHGGEMPGVAGSGAQPPPSCPLGRPVRVQAAQTTVKEYLVDVARQVPGLVWEITYATPADPDSKGVRDSIIVGALCPDGSVHSLTLYAR